ncbi:NAD(P)-dependent oxidoreductase [Herbiconiux sp. KACC 21604]|uniref:NAD-dependent epimerase/dehydratase family protein n=1 Tax=unclassified Herbiconiux TaxID=2618217 RepID=UPI0014926377|nr:NAD(P)-dependent oxidoreductase [Herbiconiux sp. SALV-R1]QJU55282.1 NAD(P)-dependent oxidoreductase [Herbiconiux sp. SALV-R1]WPO86449.1 NAD(P)-dependent oxidoreductase [Herbiconiux sp. KACC 21604]
MNDNEWMRGGTVLVTGATGRVGSRLSERLLDLGAHVRTVVLPGDPGRSRLDARITVIEGSLGDREVAESAVHSVQAVVHLAALMDWDRSAAPALFRSNVEASFHLLDAASQLPDFHRFVTVSSDEVYPALAIDGDIHEQLSLAPYSFYGLTKQLDEVLTDFYGRAYALPVTTVRFALTAAAEEITRHDGWSGRLFFASGLRALFAGLGRLDAVAVIDGAIADQDNTLLLPRDHSGASYRNHFCDVRDLIDALMLLLTEPAAVGDTFNVSGPESFEYEDVVPRLSEALGIPFVELELPGPAFSIKTDISRIRDRLGYAPSRDIETIISEVGERS